MAAIKIKPLGNHILVRRSKATVSKGGILLPDTAQEKPKEGIIVAIGPGQRDEKGKEEPLHVKAEDLVLFSSYAGTEIQDLGDEDEEYLILSEDDILGIVSRSKN